jgi:hypothetical protein
MTVTVMMMSFKASWPPEPLLQHSCQQETQKLQQQSATLVCDLQMACMVQQLPTQSNHRQALCSLQVGSTWGMGVGSTWGATVMMTCLQSCSKLKLLHRASTHRLDGILHLCVHFTLSEPGFELKLNHVTLALLPCTTPCS